jgi:hypothetical protein
MLIRPIIDEILCFVSYHPSRGPRAAPSTFKHNSNTTKTSKLVALMSHISANNGQMNMNRLSTESKEADEQ